MKEVVINNHSINRFNEKMILIEQDAGYIDIGLNPTLVTESTKFNIDPNKPVIINCILQKWGVKNKNGRIYPKDVLMREVDNYIKNMVESSSAISEADHPDCVSSSDSMIYTKNGWKYFENISDDEEIYTLNILSNKIESQKIEKKIYQHYNGLMYELKSKNSIDITVTPNHRFLLEDSDGMRFYLTAQELFDDVGDVYSSGKYKLLKKAEWIGVNDEWFTLKGLPREYFSKKHTHLYLKNKDDIKIKSEDWYAFMGIYLSEGHSSGVKFKNKNLRGYNITITQRKKENIFLIEELLNKLPIRFKKRIRKSGTVDFSINDARLYEYLYPLGSSSEKYIPNEIKNGTPELLSILLKWFQIGDGRKVLTNDNTYKESVFSTSKKLIYDLHEILIKCGKYGTITEYHPKDRYLFDLINEESIDSNGVLIITSKKTKRLVKSENSKSLYNLNFSKTNHIWIDKRSIKITPIEYNGMISCVRVPNGNFYVMKNGKAHWTGNSSVVSLDNVSHLIRKTWWGTGENQNVLFGELEIITSPAYMRNGIVCMIGDKIVEYLKRGVRLGISSRGVGTLKQVNGENVVQDDFELICFDLVASPSTPGAFLFPEMVTPDKMGEGTITKKNIVTEHEEVLNVLNKFLIK